MADNNNLSLSEKGMAFRKLHFEDGPFVMPNPWDQGSTKILTSLGFKGLGTTSAGLAASLGRVDRRAEVNLAETLDNASKIISATNLPVSADLEDGFGNNVDEIAKTIHSAVNIGLVGGSIEDFTGDIDNPIRPFSEAVERVEAAVQAAGALDFPFTITARAENYLYGCCDLKDTIARLKAYEKAGAGVLYAPALPDAESILKVCRSVDSPVNVLLGANNSLTVPQLFDLGVTRVSLGSSLARLAIGSLVKAANELREQGSISFMTEAISFSELETMMTSVENE